MNQKTQRRLIAEETLYILEKGFFENRQGKKIDITAAQEYAEQNTILYTPAMSDELVVGRPIMNGEYETHISVTDETSMNATRRLIEEGKEDVLCLNFASAKNAGGGFLSGAQAQEESIARATGLYNCQLKAENYYKSNRKIKSCFYTDHMIYSPAVPIFKTESGQNLDELKTMAIITAPAVNTGVVKHREPHRILEIEMVMKRRIEKVLTIALAHGHSTLVLGAWGCGVFQNDPDDIAVYFKEIIEQKFNGSFKEIVFAIYSKRERFINPFRREFES